MNKQEYLQHFFDCDEKAIEKVIERWEKEADKKPELKKKAEDRIDILKQQMEKEERVLTEDDIDILAYGKILKYRIGVEKLRLYNYTEGGPVRLVLFVRSHRTVYLKEPYNNWGNGY